MDFQLESKKLREERATLVTTTRELLETAQTEKRDLNDTETTAYDAADADIDKLSTKIKRLERQHELSQEQEASIEEEAEEEGISVDENKENDKKYRSAFWKSMKGGMRVLNDDERALMAVAQVRAQSAGTDSEGGFTVPQGFSDELAIALKAFGGMRNVARVIRTSTGNPMDWPTNDSTATTGEWLAENNAAATQDEVFANKTLSAFTASSKFIKISQQLMQDSAFDLEAWLLDVLVKRIGRLTNLAYTTGDGSAKPTGFVGDANIGLTTAADDAITTDEILDLFHSLDPDYRLNGTFMFNDSTFKAIRKLKDSENRYIWTPGLSDSESDSLFGKRYTINQDMADIGAGNKPMAFCDFSAYVIRDAKDFTLLRLNERFAELLQTGFLGFLRTDGKAMIANATAQNPLQVMRNTTT